jgi:hypothetical protein
MNKHLVNIIGQYSKYKYVYILYNKIYEHKTNEILGVFKANTLRDIDNDALYKIIYDRVVQNCEHFKIKNYKISRVELYEKEEKEGEIAAIIEQEGNDIKYADSFVLERYELY